MSFKLSQEPCGIQEIEKVTFFPQGEKTYIKNKREENNKILNVINVIVYN